MGRQVPNAQSDRPGTKERTRFMATLLDAPKANPAAATDYVQKQIVAARKRVRTLDFFVAGLSLAVVSLAFLFAVLLIDRYVATPKGAGWAALAVYLGLA